MAFPGLVIAALGGGSGKTILSVGIIAALRRLGYRVAPFKKGPDYIDAGWLALAGGRPCYNLDTFLISADGIRQSFQIHSQSQHLSVIEGNRGLYDGIDATGSTSTAELAKLLDLPLILILDCTKSTRTVAAIVCGCQHFDADVRIAGVVLNRVAGKRHERIIRQTIQDHCGITVAGALPKLSGGEFPERHMGLVPTHEHAWAHQAVKAAADVIAAHVDLARLLEIAGCVSQPESPSASETGLVREVSVSPATLLTETSATSSGTYSGIQTGTTADALPPTRCRIGILRDASFQFYYPENLEALTALGAELVFTSPLHEDLPPGLDGLYIGGGFPETHAQQLDLNRSYAERLRTLAQQGLPIYAECGGLMYLGQRLVLDEGSFRMTGILPVVFGFSRKPQGHGYTILRVTRPNPFYAIDTILRGHEFHYSRILEFTGSEDDMAFFMQRGRGIVNHLDGLCYKNVLATYTHIHALGTPQWAEALVRQAEAFRL